MEMEVLRKKRRYDRMFPDVRLCRNSGEGIDQILNTKENLLFMDARKLIRIGALLIAVFAVVSIIVGVVNVNKSLSTITDMSAEDAAMVESQFNRSAFCRGIWILLWDWCQRSDM